MLRGFEPIQVFRHLPNNASLALAACIAASAAVRMVSSLKASETITGFILMCNTKRYNSHIPPDNAQFLSEALKRLLVVCPQTTQSCNHLLTHVVVRILLALFAQEWC